ncbi:Septal ring factor EnvC, activator of murein hydrolases AmiA and AmiB [Paenibacillus sp. 1_12]|uniref:murein hydrolase activator EnvC family protein n=1 Tax=Paenibacillus sp. 1_12 TaxID=1566278 RepID=UPI0008E12289|nr:M23 family metallopeptidase [Paenibacillus sp. 1_12]SFL90163.1 Septal ring factor EnvC, activator of murein hydrolases AmiA and AmiB [Paenibacillus sp. 1_12]
MKKYVLTFIISAGLVGTLIAPQFAGAAVSATQRIEQELNQLRKGLSDNQKKAAESKSTIDKIAQEKQAVTKDLNTVLAEIVTANLKLNELNNQISEGKEKLAVNGKELEEVEERIDTRDKLLKSRLRLMYMNGVVSYADVLLSSTSFGDFLDRLNALNAIVNQDKHILEENRKDRTQKEEKDAQIKHELSQVGDLYSEQATRKAELDNKEKEKQVMIASLSQKEKEEKSTLEDISEDSEKKLVEEARKQSALAEARRKDAEAAAAAAAAKAKAKAGNNGSSSSAAPTPAAPFTGGKFGYPLAKVAPMTSDFGYRSDPFNGKKTMHKGIDLGAPNGTNILAAGDGVVIVASWWSGYGNTVIIDHGNGYWTLYGHIRNGGTVVEKGDAVKRGQKVAEVGSTGESTGNHLHFEVRINEDPVDPKPYLR